MKTLYKVRISLLQQGGMGADKEKNLHRILGSIERVAAREAPDFILLNETCITPYFPMLPRRKSLFHWADTVPGPTTDQVGAIARKYRTTIIFPLFEVRKGEKRDFYNACVVLGPDGEIIPGRLPSGERVQSYAKVHLGKTVYPKYVGDETAYFSRGTGFPVFDTPRARIGVLICYDRRFPEAWRVLGLSGARIVFVPTAVTPYSLGKGKAATAEDLFEAELRTRAYENLVFAAACNKGGVERGGGKEVLYFGRSCVIGPTGMTLRRAPARKAAVITQDIDLREIDEARKVFLFYQARQPATYRSLVSGTDCGCTG